MLQTVYPFYTVVVTGKDFLEKVAAMQKKYYPNVFYCASGSGSDLPIFTNRYVEGETLIYVCSGKECKLPVTSVETAIKYFSYS
jgi:uncharacterized protein YyaL (SSP411 family)